MTTAFGYDAAGAAQRLRETEIPEPVLEVARTLQAGGHAAVLVGGCVRDTLVSREHGDWDLATSARPEEVQELFRRTIATGIEHGTVTVMVGRGKDREGVEVTTFRGEGQYVDGRRPSEVTFLRDLEEDLARRDFTINAFAWDPIREVFTDVFGGLEDLRAGRIRAVGTPLDRFMEDGLRVMRAVRFAASLDFELEPDTEAAIEGALEVFDKVSRERVRVELFKLLASARPSGGLRPMARRGLWKRVLLPVPSEQLETTIAGCDARPARVEVRLAWLLRAADAPSEAALRVVESLKPSKKFRADVQRLLAEDLDELVTSTSAPRLRRRVARLGREHLADALDLLAATADVRERIHAAVEGHALSGKELAIAGRDLISEGVMPAGRSLGQLLERLLDEVLEAPERNTRDWLLERARALAPQFEVADQS